MSLFTRLFGGGAASADSAAAPAKTLEHQGFTIRSTPYKEAGRFQLRGIISKETDGVSRSHEFIRADSFATLEDANEMVFFKARQLIDQQGEYLFNDERKA